MKFRYTIKSDRETYHSGELDAATYRAAIDLMICKGQIPVELHPMSEKELHIHPGHQWHGFIEVWDVLRNKFFQSDVVFLTRYLADFLNAGMPLRKSLQLIGRYVHTQRMMSVVRCMEQSISNGEALSVAMQQFPAVFSDMYVHMIRAGEKSGALSQTVSRLAEFLEKDQEHCFKLFSVMVYPAVIFFVALGTVFILLTWVIPRVAIVFADMNQTLPVLTRALMGTSVFFSRFWWAMIIGLACTAVMMMRWYQSDQGRRNAHRMMFHIPVIGKAQRESAIGRFAYALGTLLKGGSDIVSAIQYAAGMSNNVYIHDALITIAQDVSEGMPVYRAASRTEIFAEADVGILAAGEQTGDLPSGLLRLAVFYEKKNDHRIKLIATLIEPCLILSLGLVIGLIVVAMLMPIFEMNLGAGL